MQLTHQIDNGRELPREPIAKHQVGGVFEFRQGLSGRDRRKDSRRTRRRRLGLGLFAGNNSVQGLTPLHGVSVLNRNLSSALSLAPSHVSAPSLSGLPALLTRRAAPRRLAAFVGVPSHAPTAGNRVGCVHLFTVKYKSQRLGTWNGTFFLGMTV